MKVEEVGNGSPEVTIVGSMHGDEPAGKKAIENILDKKLEFQKPVRFLIANEEALKEDTRYLEKDLNRSFPGDSESEFHEERLAAEILSEVKDSIVLDIHTTMSYPEPFATVKQVNQETVELLKAANVDKAVSFEEGDSGSMTESVDRGIVVEAGRQKSEQAVENAEEIILNFLAYFGAIDREFQTSDPDFFRYYETVEGDWEFKAENFKLVEEGEVYAERKGEKLIAEEDFYPVLMSTNGYEGQLGYKSRKIEPE